MKGSLLCVEAGGEVEEDDVVAASWAETPVEPGFEGFLLNALLVLSSSSSLWRQGMWKQWEVRRVPISQIILLYLVLSLFVDLEVEPERRMVLTVLLKLVEWWGESG